MRRFMICNQCGSYNPDTATFCGKCGGQLKAAISDAPQPASLEQVPPTINNYQTGPQMPPFQFVMPSTPPSKTPWYKGLSKPMPIWALIGSILLVTILLFLLLLSG